MESKKNIAAKILKISSALKSVEKGGRNTFQNYDYVTESDMSRAASKLFAENGVCMTTSVVEKKTHLCAYCTKQGVPQHFVEVKIECTFTDIESGESMITTCYGDGVDSGDKAVYKAITGAQKYALLKMFLVASGDDPEEVSETDKYAGRKPTVNNSIDEATIKVKINNAETIDQLRDINSALDEEQKNKFRGLLNAKKAQVDEINGERVH